MWIDPDPTARLHAGGTQQPRSAPPARVIGYRLARRKTHASPAPREVHVQPPIHHPGTPVSTGVTTAVCIGALLLLAGLAAWLWLGDWRWSVTGLLAFIAALAVATVIHGRSQR